MELLREMKKTHKNLTQEHFKKLILKIKTHMKRFEIILTMTKSWQPSDWWQINIMKVFLCIILVTSFLKLFNTIDVISLELIKLLLMVKIF